MHPFIARNIFRLQEHLLGRNSFAILRELRESARWDRGRLDDLRLRRLQNIVALAYRHTSFWRRLMDDHRILPADIQSLDDLCRFPLLVKQTLRDHREEMVWRGAGKRLQLVRTSGSTNEALQFYTSSLREAHINAARMRGHEWIGIRRGMREMYFWGSPVELSKQDRLKRFRDRLINDGLTNGFELTSERVADYVTYWKRWRPACLFGYPSSFALMVNFAHSLGLDLRELRDRCGLKVICTTSEMLTDIDRRLIADAFGVPVYDSYGLREAGLIGHECDHATMHTIDEQVILETVDPETLEPTDGPGELVITNIVSPTLPILRYRTGDIVTLSDRPCPCGLTLSRINISGGRIADFIITSEGKWVVGYSFIYICRSVPGITKFQVRQDRRGEIRILIVTDANFPPDGIARVTQAAKARLAGADTIRVEPVDDIPPAPSGKYRPVISKVTEELLNKNNSLPPDASH